MSQTRVVNHHTTTAMHLDNVDTQPIRSRQARRRRNKYFPYHRQNSADKRQQSILTNNYPVCPDVKFRRLPFYEIIADVLGPATLIPKNNQRMHKNNFQFHLTPQQVTDIVSSRINRPSMKCDYMKQVQIRFCLLETTCEQDDYFPPNVILKVNKKLCPLPTNKPGTKSKLAPRPVDITQMVRLNSKIVNTITVTWAADLDRAYAFTVALVQTLTSTDLLQRLRSKGPKEPDYTKALIKEKLKDDKDNEIATTFLRVSLMCPLGKMRMITPCRSITCIHLQCFDALLFLQMNEHKSSWNCPVCHKPLLYDNLVIDGYFQEVLISSCLPSECNEIQLNKDGNWSVQNEKEAANVNKTTVIGIDDSIRILDDLEITSSDSASSSTDKIKEKPDVNKTEVVDLTGSDSDEGCEPDSTSSGFPANFAVLNLNSPFPTQSCSFPPQTMQPPEISCMMQDQTNGEEKVTEGLAFSSSNMFYLDFEGEAANNVDTYFEDLHKLY